MDDFRKILKMKTVTPSKTEDEKSIKGISGNRRTQEEPKEDGIGISIIARKYLKHNCD